MILTSEEISFRHYLTEANKSETSPQREAYIGVSYADALRLAQKLSAHFITGNTTPESIRSLSTDRPTVVFFHHGWRTTDWAAWQAVHLFVERPPRWGGSPLVIEFYPDEKAFLDESPSRHHIDLVTTVPPTLDVNNNKGVTTCLN